MFKNIVAALSALLFITPWAGAQLVQDFDDIENWTGTGTNRSAMLIQWNDGGTPTSVVWGYRWNSGASGFDMLRAIAGNTTVQEAGSGDFIESFTGTDSSLTLVVDRYNFGDAVYSMVYNPGGPTRTQADWDSGFWEYFAFGGTIPYYDWNLGTNATYNVAGDPSYSAVVWWASQVGASDRPLVDGSWDAWSFAAGFVSTPAVQPAPAPVPEPGVMALLVLSGVVAFAARRMRRA